MNKSLKPGIYIVFVILMFLFILTLNDFRVKKQTKQKGIIIITKFDSIQKLPKRSYFYFSYYLNGIKISTCNSGLKKLFEPYKIIVKPNNFYYAKYNTNDPEVIIVEQNLRIIDTTLILNAGFSREDIKNMPK
ncbi:hypothetical protein [Flavobacterium sp.]|uniref:hypothetical protein n=1 Tax=Flavobacterium sp. TaxID=239 RepID=UPI003F69BBD7